MSNNIGNKDFDGGVNHRKKRGLRLRLSNIIKHIARLQQNQRVMQALVDMSCKLDCEEVGSKQGYLVTPDGFAVTYSERLKHSQQLSTRLLCELKVISMAVMYYRLFRATKDRQDFRSCDRYCTWLEEYINLPMSYVVYDMGHMIKFLYRPTGEENDIPHLPEWVGEETV